MNDLQYEAMRMRMEALEARIAVLEQKLAGKAARDAILDALHDLQHDQGWQVGREQARPDRDGEPDAVHGDTGNADEEVKPPGGMARRAGT